MASRYTKYRILNNSSDYYEFLREERNNIRNIRQRTGSTILGNYQRNYEVVHTVGASQNPRKFIDNNALLQIPTQIFQNNTTGATQVRTFLDIHRDEDGHYKFVDEYAKTAKKAGKMMDKTDKIFKKWRKTDGSKAGD